MMTCMNGVVQTAQNRLVTRQNPNAFGGNTIRALKFFDILGPNRIRPGM